MLIFFYLVLQVVAVEVFECRWWWSIGLTRRLTVTTNKVTRKVKVIFDKEASKMVKEVKKVQEEDKEMDWRLMTNMEVLVVAT